MTGTAPIRPPQRVAATTRWARFALFLIALHVLACTACLAIDLAGIHAAQPGQMASPGGFAGLQEIGRLLSLASQTERAIRVALMVVVGVWAFRALRRLARQIEPPREPWSVLWVIVPVANLIMPCLIARDLWRAAQQGRGRRWGWVPYAWWGLLLATAAQGVATSIALSVQTPVDVSWVFGRDAGMRWTLIGAGLLGAFMIHAVDTAPERASDVEGVF